MHVLPRAEYPFITRTNWGHKSLTHYSPYSHSVPMNCSETEPGSESVRVIPAATKIEGRIGRLITIARDTKKILKILRAC
jgi:hypothetical protein